MSEVPSGLKLESPPQPSIRDSASLMLTRYKNNKIEVLLGKRAKTMKAFPNYWSFPGGGLSRKDIESSKILKLTDDFAEMKICIVRELCEELGLTIHNGQLISINSVIRTSIVENKDNWLKEVTAGKIKFNSNGLKLIRERITPVFAPLRFYNRFFHLHVSGDIPDFNLDDQTEFDSAKWHPIDELINNWNNHSIYLPPPIFSIIRDLNNLLEEGIELDLAVKNLSSESPEEREINFSDGVICIPVKTATLPPATTTNCYLLGKKGGELLLVDPAAKNQEDIDWIMELINSFGGNVIGLLLTHRHSDHYGNLSKFKDLTGAKIWCSKHTSDFLNIKDAIILKNQQKIQLNHSSNPIEWEVLITPGHCPGHICLFSKAGLITGDMVAGYGTILIPSEGNMEEYIEQLKRITDLEPRLLFPSHGPLISVPKRVLSHYISHREKRQNQVFEAIKSKINSLEEISKYSYEDTPNVHPGLSQQQTLAHLNSLERLGHISFNNNKWELN
ncbi:MAG TPA: MBL fold metallo-hydrolase [Candidatus Poseidoniaceae archaeon]|nr:MBL fold metallo-hydrolase [Candidatus Poseidoniaceae archaeon]